MLDTPSFFSALPESKNSQALEQALDPSKDNAQTLPAPTEGKDKPPVGEGTPATPGEGGQGGTEPKPGEGSPAGAIKKEEPKPGEQPATPAKPEGDKGKVNAAAEKLILGKYKSQEEFEKAHKTLERAFHEAEGTIKKLQGGKQPTGKEMENLQYLLTNPLINPELPNPEKYVLTDGKFDMSGFMKDFTKNFSLAIQKSFLSGPLAAGQFNILKTSLLGEYDKAAKEQNTEAQAQGILTNLTEKYPRLKSDEALQRNFERAIYGEAKLRAQQAKAAGEQPKEMTAEDIEKILTDLIGKDGAAPAAPATTTPPVEPLHPGPTLNGGKATELSEEEKDIEGMKRVKNQKLF